MNVYTMWAQSNDYQAFMPADRNWKLFRSFDGRPQAADWVPVRLNVRNGRAGAALPTSDYPSLTSNVPVFSRRAKDCLEDLLTPRGEFLPLLSSVGEYYAFNVSTVLDALDEEKSVVDRFDSGRIMDVDTYQFFRDKLVGATIFKLVHTPEMDVFVTDEFIRRVNEHGLTGMGFTDVWSG